MKYVDDLDSESICRQLGITPNNYWVLLHRAKVQLRACLEKNWLKKLKSVTPDDKLNPVENNRVFVNRFVVGSIERPALMPALPEMFAVGTCISLLCLRFRSAIRACMSACLTDMLFANAYSTALLRFHVSCEYVFLQIRNSNENTM